MTCQACSIVDNDFNRKKYGLNTKFSNFCADHKNAAHLKICNIYNNIDPEITGLAQKNSKHTGNKNYKVIPGLQKDKSKKKGDKVEKNIMIFISRMQNTFFQARTSSNTEEVSHFGRQFKSKIT